MSDKDEKGEPTMEEILASIRQIISDEEKDEDGAEGEAQEAAPEEPADEPEAEPAPEPEPEPEPQPEPEPAPAPEPASDPVLELTRVVNDDGSVSDIEEAAVDDIDMLDSAPADPSGLVSNPTAHAATSAFGNLSGAVASARSMPLGNANRSLEDVVKELLKPMLRDWLDSNLPHIVERLVEREVAKLAARADRD